MDVQRHALTRTCSVSRAARGEIWKTAGCNSSICKSDWAVGLDLFPSSPFCYSISILTHVWCLLLTPARIRSHTPWNHGTHTYIALGRIESDGPGAQTVCSCFPNVDLPFP